MGSICPLVRAGLSRCHVAPEPSPGPLTQENLPTCSTSLTPLHGLPSALSLICPIPPLSLPSLKSKFREGRPRAECTCYHPGLLVGAHGGCWGEWGMREDLGSGSDGLASQPCPAGSGWPVSCSRANCGSCWIVRGDKFLLPRSSEGAGQRGQAERCVHVRVEARAGEASGGLISWGALPRCPGHLARSWARLSHDSWSGQCCRSVPL